MNRGVIYVFRVVALIGCGLSLSTFITNLTVSYVGQDHSFHYRHHLIILMLSESFLQLTASAILFVLCDTALHLTAEPHPDSDKSS